MGSAMFQRQSELTDEPLVKLADYNIACQPYNLRQILTKEDNADFIIRSEPRDVWIRKTVAEMLQKVNVLLKPYGFEVRVDSAYRPLEVQSELWSYFIKKARRELKTDNPEKIRQHASAVCADPTLFDPEDSSTWPPHVTGGAVDVGLQDINTKEKLLLDIPGYGKNIITHYAEMMPEKERLGPWPDYLKKRRILFNAMTMGGFTNNPHEWWHYDFGTPLYALENHPENPVFYYGPAPHPEK